MTVGDAVEVYRGKVRANASLKPRSKDYREMTLDFIQRSWPSLFETDVRKVSERDCENWLTRFQQQYAPTVVNNSIGTLRAVFDEAISTGARFNNPAAKLSRGDKQPSLIEKGKAWIVKNQEFLGAGASIVRKALGIPDVV